MTKGKKIAAAIAAAAIASITSATAFAAVSYYNYNLAANASAVQSYTANGDTMTLNTRPSAGAVTVKVEGLGIPGGETSETFPHAVERVGMKVTVIEDNKYDVTVKAGSVACNGTLTVNY